MLDGLQGSLTERSPAAVKAATTTDQRPRVCLAALNSAWYQSNPALYHLRETLRGIPCRVFLREFTTAEPLGDVLKGICQTAPSLVCLSAYIWNRSYLETLIPELKKLLPQARIAIGGPEAATGGYGLEESDLVFAGPGEGAFRRLAERGFSLGGGIHSSPAPPLRELPFPYHASDRPNLQGKLVYYESYRGCPYRCVYCLSATDSRREPRFDVSNPKDRRRLRSELDRLIALKPRTVKFIDRSFNSDPALARQIWREVIKRPAACEFHFEIYPDLLGEEDFRLLETAPPGRIRFELGIQTVNETISRNCRRASSWQRSRAALIALRQRTPICLHADLLAGLPGEGRASILRSLDELARCFPHEIQLGLLKILPGTPMLEIARERGYAWMDGPPYQILSTDKLTFAQVAEFQDLARAVNLYWNKQEFSSHWERIIAAGIRPSAFFQSLQRAHRRCSQPLHSVSRQDRAAIFQACLECHFPN